MEGFKSGFGEYTGDSSKTSGRDANKSYDFIAGHSKYDGDRSKAEGITEDIHLKKAHDLAKKSDLFGSRPAERCEDNEIDALEPIGHHFPKAYRNFLRWMGRSGGDFLVGSDCFYKSLKTGLKQGAQELLRDNEFPGKLPKDAFVFFMHGGYQFHYFRLGDGADPPVYSYSEVRNSVSKLSPHFSDFLVKEMENHIALKSKIDS